MYLCLMLYKEMEGLNSSKFKRLTGVKREVFDQMPDALNRAMSASGKHPSRGAPARLSNADRVFLLLMYYREYRTQFHTGIHVRHIGKSCLRDY
jgi:hypothetical protein